MAYPHGYLRFSGLGLREARASAVDLRVSIIYQVIENWLITQSTLQQKDKPEHRVLETTILSLIIQLLETENF